VRILLDECVDRRLAREIVGHEIKTVQEMGWAGVKNGQLLSLMSQHFDAFITVDSNLSFQQNLVTVAVAVFVLRASTNRLIDLRSLLPNLLAEIPSAKAGTVTVIGPLS
jgi:hypothetical protein